MCCRKARPAQTSYGKQGRVETTLRTDCARRGLLSPSLRLHAEPAPALTDLGKSVLVCLLSSGPLQKHFRGGGAVPASLC